MTASGQRPGVVGGEPDVHEDVLEDLGEVAGVAMERVVVEQQDRDPDVLGGAQEAGQQQGVCRGAGRRRCRRTPRGTAEADPASIAVHASQPWTSGLAIRYEPSAPGRQSSSARTTWSTVGLASGSASPAAIGGDALRADCRRLAAASRRRARVRPSRAFPTPAGPAPPTRAGRSRALVRRPARPSSSRAGRPGSEAGVHEEVLGVGGAQQPPRDLVDAELAVVAPGSRRRLARGSRSRTGAAPAPYGEADHRVEERRAERARPRGLVEHRLELEPIQVPQHDAVTVVVDEARLAELPPSDVTQADSRS